MPGSQQPVRLSLRKKLVFTAIALFGLTVVAELAIRVGCLATGRTPYTVATPWCRADDELLYSFKPGFQGRIFDTDAHLNEQGLRSADIPFDKARETSRVLCLGDSRTFGYAVRHMDAYPMRLQLLLHERFGRRRHEVINAGTHGYTSYQGLRFLELHGLRYQPDIVTVAFDFNDRRFVLDPDQADGPEYFRQAARGLRWRNRMGFSFLLLGINKLMQHAHGTDTWAKSVLERPSQRLEDLHCRVDVAGFERNLEAIARICRDRNIRCVLILMEDAPQVEKVFEEGRHLREEKKYDEAVVAFTELLGERPPEKMRKWQEPLALWGIGMTREAQGRPEEAKAAFRDSAQKAAFWSIMGGLPIRPTAPYLETMRRVAAKFNLPTVDIAAKFRNHPEYYYDFCHYTADGEDAIARELLECLNSLP